MNVTLIACFFFFFNNMICWPDDHAHWILMKVSEITQTCPLFHLVYSPITLLITFIKEQMGRQYRMTLSWFSPSLDSQLKVIFYKQKVICSSCYIFYSEAYLLAININIRIIIYNPASWFFRWTTDFCLFLKKQNNNNRVCQRQIMSDVAY